MYLVSLTSFAATKFTAKVLTEKLTHILLLVVSIQYYQFSRWVFQHPYRLYLYPSMSDLKKDFYKVFSAEFEWQPLMLVQGADWIPEACWKIQFTGRYCFLNSQMPLSFSHLPYVREVSSSVPTVFIFTARCDRNHFWHLFSKYILGEIIGIVKFMSL